MSVENRVAEPGDDDLDFDVDNLLITAIIGFDGNLILRFAGGDGWWVNHDEDDRVVEDMHDISSEVTLRFQEDSWARMEGAFMAIVKAWHENHIPIRMLCAAGRATLCIGHDGKLLPLPRTR